MVSNGDFVWYQMRRERDYVRLYGKGWAENNSGFDECSLPGIWLTELVETTTFLQAE
jgi:hypothetical protein